MNRTITIDNETFEPLAAFLNALELACDAEHTGRFYIATAENHAACLDLDKGIISAAKYRLKKGAEAVDLLCKAHWLRYRFDTDCQIRHDDYSLPATSIILHKLENALEETRVMPSAEDVKKTSITNF